jgi:hypothetical protein
MEYRLLVASVFDTSLTSFASSNELTYGASARSPAAGDGDQHGRHRVGRHARGTPAHRRAGQHRPCLVRRGVHADILRGGVDAGRWDEVRWEGKPGERSIWLIKATGNNRPQSRAAGHP